MYRLIIFILVTIGIVLYSRTWLRDPRHHGFYRFFAFECILALVLVNVAYWIREPFSPFQIVSWIFLVVSIFLVVLGVRLLRLVGKPRDAVEDTTKLVKVGAYKYIRHPLYASLLFLGLGAFFKDISIVSTGLMVAVVVFLVATAKIEERENINKFGAEYEEYMKETKMFVPFLL